MHHPELTAKQPAALPDEDEERADYPHINNTNTACSLRRALLYVWQQGDEDTHRAYTDTSESLHDGREACTVRDAEADFPKVDEQDDLRRATWLTRLRSIRRQQPCQRQRCAD